MQSRALIVEIERLVQLYLKRCIMKVLIKIKRSPEQLFLVDLNDKSLIDEITKLINRKKHSKAIVEALSRGSFKRELRHEELGSTGANLILTEKNARWDLT